VAFTVPTFNLVVNVWRQGNAPPAVPDAFFVCNLAWGRRVSSPQGLAGSANEPLLTLLLPAGSDIRGPQCVDPDTCVEVPAGSGRIYAVVGLDDIGKGFANEHRAAVLQWTILFGFWPSPIP